MVILVIIITFIAALGGMISGFGTSTIMIPLMLLILPLHQTLIFVGIIHLFAQIIRILFTYKEVKFRFLIWFAIPAILFAYLGAKAAYLLDQKFILQFMGFIFVLYAALLFFNPKLEIKPNEKSAFLGGCFSGFTAGLTGLGGSIRALFLSIYNLPKLQYIFILSLLGAITDTTRVITYLTAQPLEKTLWSIILIALPISFVGTWVGKLILNFIPQDKFRLIICFFLIFVAFMLIFKTNYFVK